MNNTEQFYKALEEDQRKRGHYTNYIVRVRYKYFHETKWRYSNQYLEFDWQAIDWCWLNDWNEGQQDVEFLGFIAVEDIETPSFLTEKE